MKMKVVCIEDDGFYLELGRVYEVLGIKSGFYFIMDDSGSCRYFPDVNFGEIPFCIS